MKLTALFLFIIIPIIYYTGEITAVFALEIFSVISFIYIFYKYGSSFYLNKLGKIFGVLLAVWFFTIGRSILVSVLPDVSFIVFHKLTALLLICLSMTFAFASDRDTMLKECGSAASIAGLLFGLLALSEYIEAPPIPSTWLDPSSVSIFRTRCATIFTDPNIFGSYLSIIFTLTLGWTLGAKEKKDIVWGSLSMAFSGFGIFSTLSRGSWLAAGAGLFVAFVLSKYAGFSLKSKTYESHRPILYGLFFLLASVFFIMPFKYRLFTMVKPSDMTFAQRTYITKGILKNIKLFPVAGHGFHTFNQVYPRYRIVGGDYPLNAHNEFLHSLIETGFLSAFMLFMICIYSVRILLNAAKNDLTLNKKPELYCYTACFFMLVIQNLSGFSARMLPTMVLFIPVFAFIFSLGFRKRPAVCSSECICRYGKYSIFALAFIFLYSCSEIYAFQYEIDKGRKFIGAGNFNKGLLTLQRCYGKNPYNFIAVTSLAEAYEELYKTTGIGLADILHMYELAYDINPTESMISYKLAKYYVAANDYKKTDEMFRTSLKYDPGAEYYRIDYAVFLIYQGKLAEAKEVVDRGLTYSPGFHDVYKGYKKLEELQKVITRNLDKH